MDVCSLKHLYLDGPQRGRLLFETETQCRVRGYGASGHLSIRMCTCFLTCVITHCPRYTNTQYIPGWALTLLLLFVVLNYLRHHRYNCRSLYHSSQAARNIMSRTPQTPSNPRWPRPHHVCSVCSLRKHLIITLFLIWLFFLSSFFWPFKFPLLWLSSLLRSRCKDEMKSKNQTLSPSTPRGGWIHYMNHHSNSP